MPFAYKSSPVFCGMGKPVGFYLLIGLLVCISFKIVSVCGILYVTTSSEEFFYDDIDPKIQEKCARHNMEPGPFCLPDYELIDDCCVRCMQCFAGQGKPPASGPEALCTGKCVSCVDGQTYNDRESTLPCRDCTNCGNPLLNRETKVPCSRHSDTKCGGCKQGYYDPSSIGDSTEPCWKCKPGIKGCPNIPPAPPVINTSTDKHDKPLHPRSKSITRIPATINMNPRRTTQSNQQDEPMSYNFSQQSHGTNGTTVMGLLGLAAVVVIVVIVAYARRGDVCTLLSTKVKEQWKYRTDGASQEILIPGKGKNNDYHDYPYHTVKIHELRFTDGNQDNELTAVNTVNKTPPTRIQTPSGSSDSLTVSGGAIQSRPSDSNLDYRADLSECTKDTQNPEEEDSQTSAVSNTVNDLMEIHGLSTVVHVDDSSIDMPQEKSVSQQPEYISEQASEELKIAEKASRSRQNDQCNELDFFLQLKVKGSTENNPIVVKMSPSQDQESMQMNPHNLSEGKQHTCTCIPEEESGRGWDHDDVKDDNKCSACGQSTRLFEQH